MEDAVKERLENQAFMATVMVTGGEGMTVAAWLEILLSGVGGFIGDILFSPEGEDVRVVLAAAEPPFEPPATVGDIVPTVLSAANGHVASIRDRGVAAHLPGVANFLRKKYAAGGMLECSMTGCGLALDFVRGRHMVTSGAETLALHVHGKTVVGRRFDSSSDVVKINPDGTCELADGDVVPMEKRAKNETPVEGGAFEGGEGAVQQRSPLAERIMRSSAGSLMGPEPTAMVFSRGEDGRVMVVVKTPSANGGLTVRFIPKAVQILQGGTVVAQTGFEEVSTVLGWLLDGSVEVLRVSADGKLDLSRASVEIRASV